MVKTTYALTLFAAVSLAAPVSNIEGNGNELGSRATNEGSTEHKNIIDGLPIISELLGNVSSRSAHLSCMNQYTNEAREQQKGNQRRDLGGDGLSGLPLVGSLFGKVSSYPLLSMPERECDTDRVLAPAHWRQQWRDCLSPKRQPELRSELWPE